MWVTRATRGKRHWKEGKSRKAEDSRSVATSSQRGEWIQSENDLVEQRNDRHQQENATELLVVVAGVTRWVTFFWCFFISSAQWCAVLLREKIESKKRQTKDVRGEKVYIYKERERERERWIEIEKDAS